MGEITSSAGCAVAHAQLCACVYIDQNICSYTLAEREVLRSAHRSPGPPFRASRAGGAVIFGGPTLPVKRLNN